MHPKYPHKTEEDDQENRAQRKETNNELVKATFHVSFDGLRLVGGVQTYSNKKKSNQYLRIRQNEIELH